MDMFHWAYRLFLELDFSAGAAAYANLGVNLVLISLVVGFLMSVFGVNPQSLVNGAIDLVHDALRDSTGLLRSFGFYVVTGAVIVVPVWLVLRLTSRRR